ncbi:MAG TPA: hydroxylamine reductase [Syntrophales bacterium]|mgnify:FL=1|nr:hydroxylamine reductase [Syntrophales bacterium]
MFCYQCQETIRNQGCTVRGFCGKPEVTANLQDLLIYLCKGIAVYAERRDEVDRKAGRFVCEALFVTITNVGWDDEAIIGKIEAALEVREGLRAAAGAADMGGLPDCAVWEPRGREDILAKAAADEVRINASPSDDIRSLRSLIVFGLKGICAYADHAAVLGYERDDIYRFVFTALAATTRDLPEEDLAALVMKAGETAVTAMALLDQAHNETYGHPEITAVPIGVRTNPGILISGHDLRDMEDLLRQTEGTGVDVYTHGEMLPAHYYPAFKKYGHLAGNYGSSWWHQNEDFETFNGPVILTTNCLIPVKKENTYLGRLFTTGNVGYPGAVHIPDRPAGGMKDFGAVIALAKRCPPPREIETGRIVGGFAHHQVEALMDKVVEAVRSGAVRRFIVMAGCDGRHKSRGYFTEVARNLPGDAVILTAGCAKYRYNKLPLGDIGGIPRVLDAGQCNDSYSLALIALKLKERLGLEDLGALPVSFDIAWYEQKAVAVLLALLALGFKGIRLGPTLPGFLSPAVAGILVERFDIKPIGDVQGDIEAMISRTT